MSAALLRELQGAGVDVRLDGAKLKLRGNRAALTPELLARVKEQKGPLLAALAGPPPDLPLVHEPDVLTEAQVDAICRLMDRAGLAAFWWVLGDGGRADQYEQRLGFSDRDGDLAGAVDYLLYVHKPDGRNRAERIAKLLHEKEGPLPPSRNGRGSSKRLNRASPPPPA
jgi:hypothetical protein